MQKLLALLEVFRRGSVVADAAAWKNGGMSAAALVALFSALQHAADAFGYPVIVAPADFDALAAGVVAVAHILLTTATSEKVGLPAKPAANTTNLGDGTA